mmetsp:Transcript_25116/g.79588  ORF Transcript_25116/g.79588 Transcript_25116/m.79588 type:complete len:236 (+) Transcript_25116:432-1139(+)
MRAPGAWTCSPMYPSSSLGTSVKPCLLCGRGCACRPRPTGGFIYRSSKVTFLTELMRCTIISKIMWFYLFAPNKFNALIIGLAVFFISLNGFQNSSYWIAMRFCKHVIPPFSRLQCYMKFRWSWPWWVTPSTLHCNRPQKYTIQYSCKPLYGPFYPFFWNMFKYFKGEDHIKKIVRERKGHKIPSHNFARQQKITAMQTKSIFRELDSVSVNVLIQEDSQESAISSTQVKYFIAL